MRYGKYGKMWLQWRQKLRLKVWGQTEGKAGPWWLRLIRSFLISMMAFRSNHLSVHASGLSFYLLLSVVPFLAVLFMLLKIFQVQSLFKQPLLEFLAGGNRELMTKVGEYAEQAEGGMVGGMGFMITLLVGFVLIQRVKSTLNVVWEVERPTRVRSRIIEYLTVLAVTPLLLAAALAFHSLLGNEWVQAQLAIWGGVNRAYLFLGNASGFVALWLITYYAYSYLPDTRVVWWAALTGALFAGTALILAERFYVVSLVVILRQNFIYGALALLPTLMLWFYLAWLIFLFGAQLSCVAQNYLLFLERRRDQNVMTATWPYQVVMTLAGLERLYQESGKAVFNKTLARRLGHPLSLVERALRLLGETNLVVRLQNKRQYYVPLEKMEMVTVHEVLDRAGLVPGFSELPSLAKRMGGEALLQLFQQSNRALTAPLEEMTVFQLAQWIPGAKEPKSKEREHPLGAADGATPTT